MLSKFKNVHSSFCFLKISVAEKDGTEVQKSLLSLQKTICFTSDLELNILFLRQLKLTYCKRRRYEDGSRATAPEENCPPALILTLTLTQTLTGGQFSLVAIVQTPTKTKINNLAQVDLQGLILGNIFLLKKRQQG